MIIRVRGAKGACRVEVEPGDPPTKLFEQASVKLKMGATSFKLTKNPDGSGEVVINAGSIALAGLKHGDMIYLKAEAAAADNTRMSGFLDMETGPELDDVDRALDRQDGLVHRKKNPALCRGAGCLSDRSKCVHCMPLEPFDASVLNARDPPIKSLSFHSYLRKQRGSGNAGKSSSTMNLQEPRCTVDTNCDNCSGWPKSICSRCQPSAMKLQKQEFRHVDFVSFEAPEVVGNLVGAWQQSGVQRIGYLYGRYAAYDQVPLGIQAVVTAVYEPPQSSEPDGVELLDDPNAETVDRLAAMMGLSKVGWVFTDLEMEPGLQPPNNTKYKRFISDDNSVLTGYEVIYAAMQQTEHPNAVDKKYSSVGAFGSKFVTCVISAGEENEIGIKAYQATNNAMALVRAEALNPSAIKRNEVCVAQSDAEHYIPEVLYVSKNEYGREVMQKAEPALPLEYLFVTLEAAAKMDGKPVFGSQFVIGNRAQLGELQDLPAVQRHFARPGPSLLTHLSDFHLLLYLATNDVVPFMEEMPAIIAAIQKQDNLAIEQWAAHSEKWQTLQMLMQFQGQ